MSLDPRPRRVASVLFILALTIRGAASAPQVIATDGAPPGPRTGLIVGQVVDGTTGAPVPEAIVRLTMPKYLENLPTTPKGRVMADSEGRYFFSELPAGEYYIGAEKDGYGGGAYGQRRAVGQEPALPLGEGERRTDAKLTLWKYAVIAGTVVDEAGEPVVGVSVQALVKDFLGGRVRYGKMTTQRGPCRPRQPTTAACSGFALDARAVTWSSRRPRRRRCRWRSSTARPEPEPSERTCERDHAQRLQRSESRIGKRRSGQPRTQQVGDFALLTMTSRADSSTSVAGGPHGGVPDDVLSCGDDGGCGDARSRSRAARNART